MMKRWVLFGVLVLTGGQARADGMAYSSVTSASAGVRATAQRAVLWLRDGVWEVHIQPVFAREIGGAAWVVPFPVRPGVQPSNADFFDQLEVLTGPIFLQTCTDSCGYGIDGGAASGGGEVRSAGASVVVWERGRVGDLDYLILSSASGDSLAAWLSNNDYRVPPEAGPVFETFTREGAYFFAAKIAPDADPAAPLAPVRFTLPGTPDPAYPMRMTGLGVPDEAALSLTLWVVSRKTERWAPSHHRVIDLRQVAGPTDPESYERAVGDVLAANPGALVRLYSYPASEDDRRDGVVCSQYGYGGWSDGGPGGCVALAALGVPFPASWSSEIEEIFSRDAWLSRYQGRIDRAHMGRDVSLQPVADVGVSNNVWEVHTGSCRACPGDEPYHPIDAGSEDEQCTDAGFDPAGSGGRTPCENPGCASAGAGALVLLPGLLLVLAARGRARLRRPASAA